MVYAQLSCHPLVVSALPVLLFVRINFQLVGAMFYLSPTLTLLMLAVVPPVSLGAVSICCTAHIFGVLMCSQVFYGRYIKQLSNRTQEAVGEMTKVISC
jgi:hypothetical protein